MKILSHGLNTLNEAGKYTCATAEYTGLVSYSCLKRGANAVRVNVLKITRPVTSTISRPFVFIKEETSKIFVKTILDVEALKRLEEKMLQIEDRLSLIEKHGVRSAETPVTRKKKLDEGRREVLQMIARENLLLKKAG